MAREGSTMNPPVLTGLYAALCALIVLGLTMNVVRLRRRFQVGIGDGGQQQLACACRAHANATETIPLLLLMLALVEINGASALAIHAYGGLLVLARAAHAFGLSGTPGVSFGRFYGTLATWLVALGLATQLIIGAF
jgi:uncharacterized membrane protein YecN with MAPEG domain